MSVNIKDRITLISNLPSISKSEIDASKCTGSFVMVPLQSRNEPQAILQDLKSIRSALQLSQSHQIAHSERLKKRICIVCKQIKILKPENIFTKWVFFIFQRFFKREL